jgi:hypothetical protein
MANLANLFYNGDIVIFSGGNDNPAMIKDTDRRKQRRYNFDYSDYRHIASCAAFQHDNKVNKIMFFTFTIKQNLTDTSQTNKAWSYFLKLMRTRHKLNSFIWVAERQKRGAVHYHTLLDIPFIKYSEIKLLFSRTFARYNIEVSEKNSVSGSKNGNSIVSNVDKAVKYLTKYMTKELNQSFSGRNYAISNNINIKPRKINVEQAQTLAETAQSVFKTDYITVIHADLKEAIEVYKSKETELQTVEHLQQTEQRREQRRDKRIKTVNRLDNNTNTILLYSKFAYQIEHIMKLQYPFHKMEIFQNLEIAQKNYKFGFCKLYKPKVKNDGLLQTLHEFSFYDT